MHSLHVRLSLSGTVLGRVWLGGCARPQLFELPPRMQVPEGPKVEWRRKCSEVVKGPLGWALVGLGSGVCVGQPQPSHGRGCPCLGAAHVVDGTSNKLNA